MAAAIHDSNLYDVAKAWADKMNQKLSSYGIIQEPAKEEKSHNRLNALKLKYDPENVFHQNPVNIDPKSE